MFRKIKLKIVSLLPGKIPLDIRVEQIENGYLVNSFYVATRDEVKTLLGKVVDNDFSMPEK